MSKPVIHKEYRVDLEWKNGKASPINKVLTERGTVSIYPHEAEINNANVTRTKLWYEEEKEKQIRKPKTDL